MTPRIMPRSWYYPVPLTGGCCLWAVLISFSIAVLYASQTPGLVSAKFLATVLPKLKRDDITSDGGDGAPVPSKSVTTDPSSTLTWPHLRTSA